jgi:hypothetical protein
MNEWSGFEKLNLQAQIKHKEDYFQLNVDKQAG